VLKNSLTKVYVDMKSVVLLLKDAIVFVKITQMNWTKECCVAQTFHLAGFVKV